MEKPEARCTPAKPPLVTIVHCEADHEPLPPSELVTLGTSRAAASAVRARASSVSAEGSVGSKRSRSGSGRRARRAGSARLA